MPELYVVEFERLAGLLGSIGRLQSGTTQVSHNYRDDPFFTDNAVLINSIVDEFKMIAKSALASFIQASSIETDLDELDTKVIHNGAIVTGQNDSGDYVYLGIQLHILIPKPDSNYGHAELQIKYRTTIETLDKSKILPYTTWERLAELEDNLRGILTNIEGHNLAAKTFSRLQEE